MTFNSIAIASKLHNNQEQEQRIDNQEQERRIERKEPGIN